MRGFVTGRSNGQAIQFHLLRPNEGPEKARCKPPNGPAGVAPPVFLTNNRGHRYYPARCNTLKRTEMCRPKMWDLTVPPEAGTDGKQVL